jgi:hypothetical protein
VKEVRNEIEKSFCKKCLLLFSCPFSLLLYFPLLLSNKKRSARKNNKFHDNDSDLTPPNDQLELMDAYMLHHQLLNFMQQVLEGTNQSFYQNNSQQHCQ